MDPLEAGQGRASQETAPGGVAELSAKLDGARRLVAEMDGRLELETLNSLLSGLHSAADPAQLVQWAETLSASPAAVYLQARFALESDSTACVRKWEKFFSLSQCQDRMALLLYVQALCKADRYREAALQLRRALSGSPPHTFFPKVDRTLARVMAHEPLAARRCRIAVLGSSTTALMVAVLRAVCFRDGIHAEFYEGPYGGFRQEILDPHSGLQRFQPEIVFIVVHWRDLNLPAWTEDGTFVDTTIAEYLNLWRVLGERCKCAIVQHAFDLPPEEAYGYLADSLGGGRSWIIQRLNTGLIQAAPSNVSLLNVQRVAMAAGAAAWDNPMLWYHARQHPSPAALPALAERQCAHIRSLTGLTRKVLVCDLDNTLWGGVIGEDGLSGIQIGPGSARGEAYADLQQYLLELKQRGVLLAVCSKNNAEDARLPFEQHEHMRLRLGDFSAFVANWSDKASNLQAIAEGLSLGADSLVFLDDNPVEREWVRSHMPEVAVVELGPHPYSYVRDLDRGNYFFALTLSAEDRLRSEAYQSEAVREGLRAFAGSLEEFLESLQLRAQCVPVTVANLARVTQLVNKTNQFNLTTKRYTETQLREFAVGQGTWMRAFSLADRFGDYGLIGVLICVPAREREWVVDTWLMSCRSLGRGMEQFMFDHMVRAAQRSGIRTIRSTYRKTARNGLVERLPAQLGFMPDGVFENEANYVLDVRAENGRSAFIRDESPEYRLSRSPEDSIAELPAGYSAGIHA